MTFYLLFFAAISLVLYRIFRPRGLGDRFLFFTLLQFLVFTFAVHPWISHSSSTWLRVLEDLLLATLSLWLAVRPLAARVQARKGKGSFSGLRDGKGPMPEIISACRMLSEARQGGLIALQRKDSLEPWIQSGISLDSKIRREIIFSIFTPPGALHDGGMVIQKERIAAAGALFPLSKRLDLPTELGTRHRAGLGLSEAADAVILIVSEETGKISLADGGSLFYDVKVERLGEMIEAALKNRLAKKKKSFPSLRDDILDKAEAITKS